MSVYSDPKLNVMLRCGLLLTAIAGVSDVGNAQNGQSSGSADVLIVPPDRIIQGTINGQRCVMNLMEACRPTSSSILKSQHGWD
jgi:hypothetical protein